jgi:hypothetical protein
MKTVMEAGFHFVVFVRQTMQKILSTNPHTLTVLLTSAVELSNEPDNQAYAA